MTDLVSLLFIAIIPIGFTCLLLFGNNCWTHKCHFKRKNDHKHLFSWVPHLLINKKFICQLGICLCSPHYNCREEYKEGEKYFLPLWKYETFTCDRAHAPLIEESQRKGDWAITLCIQWCLTIYRTETQRRNDQGSTMVHSFVNLFLSA